MPSPRDEDVTLGTLLFPALAEKVLDEQQAASRYGADATRIAHELVRLGSFSGVVWNAATLSSGQAESLRKMLLAIVTDPRLVLVKLAYQLEILREAKNLPATERERLARETREIYAPLANRSRGVATKVGAGGSEFSLSRATELQNTSQRCSRPNASTAKNTSPMSSR